VRYLLDTNICVYALKNRPPAVLDRLREVGQEAVAVSVITVLELRQGAEKSQAAARAHQRLDAFLGPMPVLSFDIDAAVVGARIRAHLERAGIPIGDLDSLIAAQALAAKLLLVTNNLREFERVPGLHTENWV
jgi:tRNA(fMet)-specific endonuclease VapC